MGDKVMTPLDVTRAGIAAICARHDLDVDKVVMGDRGKPGRRGSRKVFKARCEIAIYLTSERGYSRAAAGRLIGRHWSSIVHQLTRAQRALLTASEGREASPTPG